MSSYSSSRSAKQFFASRHASFFLIFLSAAISGCAPIWNTPPTKNGAGVGAAAGAALGAGLGAVVGSATGEISTGLVIGTAAGATVGALVGNEIQKQQNALGNGEDLKKQNEQLDQEKLEIDDFKSHLNDNSAQKNGPALKRSAAAGSGVTVVNPSSRSGTIHSMDLAYSGGNQNARYNSNGNSTGRVYINPPSTLRSAGAAGQQVASIGSGLPAGASAGSSRQVNRIPAPPLQTSSRIARVSPPAAALPVTPGASGLSGTKTAAVKNGTIIETTKSVLPNANTGSILPPPASDKIETADDGLPKLDVDDGTVKALEADGASDEEVLGSVAEPIEGPDAGSAPPRARLEEAAAAPAVTHSSTAQLSGGLPPPARDAAAETEGQLIPSSGEKNLVAAKTLPQPEKEIVKGAKSSSPVISSEGSSSKTGSAPPVITSTNECKQATTEVQRAKNAVSDADRLFYYRRAVRLCSIEPAYHVEIGKLYINLGRVDDAKFEFRQAIDLDPSNQPAREHLTKLESEGGKL